MITKWLQKCFFFITAELCNSTHDLSRFKHVQTLAHVSNLQTTETHMTLAKSINVWTDWNQSVENVHPGKLSHLTKYKTSHHTLTEPITQLNANALKLNEASDRSITQAEHNELEAICVIRI